MPVVDAAPFRALRYDPAVAGDPAATSAPAYDDVGRFTYAHHRTASPYTVLELLAGGDDGYRGAGATFRRWRRTGVLVEDSRPAYYLYEIHELRHGIPAVLRGVLAAVTVTDRSLLPHESVDASRVRSRVARLEAVPADLAPVFAVHTAAPPDFRAIVDAHPTAPPVVAFTDEHGADHRVWAVRDAEAIDALTHGMAQVTAVIADGHHRHAAAVERARRQPSADRTLAYLVDGATYGPQLLPVHRRVDPLPDDVAERLSGDFRMESVATQDIDAALEAAPTPAFALLHHGGAALLVARDAAQLHKSVDPERSEAWRRLPSAVWESVVRPRLGPTSVTYHAATPRLLADVDASPAAGLFLLPAPSLDDVYACALAGEAMPAKTTWFRPKPRAGLVMRSVDSSR